MKVENLKFDAERNQFTGQITATVISLGDTMQKNVNGTEYVVGSIQFDGKVRSAICYKANLNKGIDIGVEYLCNVTFTSDRPNEPIIAISSLTGAVRASAEDFNFDFAAALAEAGVGAEQVA